MIRVLIADDSSFMRVALTHILKSENGILVVGEAVDGRDAFEKVMELKPDVVLLDIEMPVMDGLTALSYIMAQCPTPVLIISGLGERDKRIAIKSLKRGAVDFIAKPSGVISYDIDRIRDEIISRIRAAAEADVRKLLIEPPQSPYLTRGVSKKTEKEIVVIGASTGGPRAIETVLSGLRPDTRAAVVVVQHMSDAFIPSFAERLQWECYLNVSVAQDRDDLLPGRVLVAPGSRNIGIEQEGDTKRISVMPETQIFRPIDHAMESAARVYGAESLGVLLTGAGSDGSNGLRAIQGAGGVTIAEDESSCLIYGMPKAAIDMGVVDVTAPLPRIAEAIMREL